MTGTTTTSAARRQLTPLTVTSSGIPGPDPDPDQPAVAHDPTPLHEPTGDTGRRRPVRMQITRMHALLYETFDPPHRNAHAPGRSRPRPGLHDGPVKLVPAHPAPGLGQRHCRTRRRHPDTPASAARPSAPSRRSPRTWAGRRAHARDTAARHTRPRRAPHSRRARQRPYAEARWRTAQAAYTSGNPPPMTNPAVPSGSSSSRSGSKATTSAPAAVSSSACSA